MSVTDTSQTLTGEFIRLYPDQVAHILEELPAAETARLIEATAPSNASGLLERLNPRLAANVIAELGDEAARNALKGMLPTKAAPILASLSNATRERILALVDPRLAEHFRELLTYPADTAGALMDPRITAFDSDLTVEDALRRMRTFKEKELARSTSWIPRASSPARCRSASSSPPSPTRSSRTSCAACPLR
jgi:magnesium transporter